MSHTESSKSRREFLTTTAAVAGAAALFGSGRPAVARPAFPIPIARPRTPLEPGGVIKMGVIGTGGMGTGHCDAFVGLAKKGLEKVEIVALADVCDPRLDNAKKLCESGQSTQVATYRNYKELLARADLHGVLIASPEHWHAQHAIDAIGAGKDVYCEKPMTLDLKDAMRLRETCLANKDIILQVGTQMMQLPKYQAAKKLIAEGAIGKPTFSQTSYCRNSKTGEWNYYTIDPAWEPGKNLDWDAWCGPLGKAEWDPKVYARWRRYKKYSSGIIGDLLVHVMTPMVMALDVGWPTRVTAAGTHMIDMDMENFDQVNLTIEFEKGHVMIVAGSTCNEQGLEIMVRGHKGTLHLGGTHCELTPERIWADDVDAQKVECADIGNDQDVHRLAWLSSIRTRQQPTANIEMGTKIMVIVDLASRSMWEGKAFTFDPKTMASRSA